jgi:hypothetical protein
MVRPSPSSTRSRGLKKEEKRINGAKVDEEPNGTRESYGAAIDKLRRIIDTFWVY